MTRKPSPQERARIRAASGCDDTTIKNVFAVLNGEEPKRKPSEASQIRVIGGARAVGFPVPSDPPPAAA